MNALRARILLLTFLLGGIFAPASTVYGQRIPHRTLREAREKLREYEAGPALEAITSLTKLLAGRERLGAHDRDEARFLRAISAADLLLLSGRAGFEPLEPSIARALGVPVGQSRTHVADALRGLLFGRFRALAEDAIAALESGGAERVEGRVGSRVDLARLTSVAATLASDGPNAGLALLARDPCEGGDCDPARLGISPQSRRALAAFEGGLSAAARLDRAADFGDPFARAALDEIEELASRLAAARLRLPPQPEPGIGAMDRGAAADVFVTVTEATFVVQSVITYGLRDRAVKPISPRGCGERLEVPVPSSLGSRARALDALSAALPKECGARVAIAAEDTVAAHLVVRALESVRAAGLRFVGLSGVDAAGELAVHPMNLTHAQARAAVFVAGPHLVVARGAKRDKIPLDALVLARTEELGRLARVLASEGRDPLRVAGDVPFLALRVILRALVGAAPSGSP